VRVRAVAPPKDGGHGSGELARVLCRRRDSLLRFQCAALVLDGGAQPFAIRRPCLAVVVAAAAAAAAAATAVVSAGVYAIRSSPC